MEEVVTPLASPTLKAYDVGPLGFFVEISGCDKLPGIINEKAIPVFIVGKR